jgi:type IV pilus assembly protein PilV
MMGKNQSGAVLLEGLISILIFSVGILALVGLQAASMKNTTQAKMRIDASLVANQRLGQIWVDIPNMANYAEEDTEVDSLPDGKRTTSIAGDQVTVTVTWQMPGDSTTQSFTTIARINTNT